MANSFRQDLYWQKIFKYTLVTANLALILVIMVTALEDADSWFGFAERLLVANMIIWVEVTAIKLFQLSLNPGNQ